jgi:oxidase EvaA
MTILNTATDDAFLASALARVGACLDEAGIERWLQQARESHRFAIEQIPFSGLSQWLFEATTGNLVHASGRFFKIEGIWVETNFGGVPQWSQPIINQAEIGILGILAQRKNGILHFLMQAKMEPGNINTVQIAPTLQATRSNYTRVHAGRSPPYLDYFQGVRPRRVLVDILQSEQGARFLRKRNRNMIVEVPEDEPVQVAPDYAWLTLGQLQRAMRADNVVNMDARTVLSCVSFGKAHKPVRVGAPGGIGALMLSSLLDGGCSQRSDDEVISWFTEMKSRYELLVERIPLKLVRDWERTAMDIHHRERDFFTVIAVRVEAENREVAAWTQPLVKPHEPGIVAFIVKPIHGVLHFLVQAKVEPGNFDVVEMAPTVQCLTGSYRTAKTPPSFLEYVLSATPDRVAFDTLQSEEGGRFYREQNRNMIVLAGPEFPESIPDNYIWLSLGQIKSFIRYNNFVNVQCRCLLGCIPVG